MGPPLPRAVSWFAVEAYADRLGCDAGERETLHQVLGCLDGMKLKHDAEEAKRQTEGV